MIVRENRVIMANGGQDTLNGHQSILVVDDDQNILKMLWRVFELEGFDVMVASSAEPALALLEKRTPDLVVLDIMMPGLDGFQVLNSIRKYSDIPVIMLTARVEVSCVKDALAQGADDYLKKPFSILELLARVRAKLRQTEPTRDIAG